MSRVDEGGWGRIKLAGGGIKFRKYRGRIGISGCQVSQKELKAGRFRVNRR